MLNPKLQPGERHYRENQTTHLPFCWRSLATAGSGNGSGAGSSGHILGENPGTEKQSES